MRHSELKKILTKAQWETLEKYLADDRKSKDRYYQRNPNATRNEEEVEF